MPCYAEEVSESIMPSDKIYIFVPYISTSREVLARSFDALASSAYQIRLSLFLHFHVLFWLV